MAQLTDRQERESSQLAYILTISGFVGVCVLLAFHHVWQAGVLALITIIFKNTTNLD
jgi:hypothetical protein